VRIVDLARHMIRLSGFEPDLDIAITFTGLRPGEKLYEELVADDEQVVTTPHDRIKVLRPGRVPLPDQWLPRLESEVAAGDARAIVATLRELVPAYQPDPRHGVDGSAMQAPLPTVPHPLHARLRKLVRPGPPAPPVQAARPTPPPLPIGRG